MWISETPQCYYFPRYGDDGDYITMSTGGMGCCLVRLRRTDSRAQVAALLERLRLQDDVHLDFGFPVGAH